MFSLKPLKSVPIREKAMSNTSSYDYSDYNKFGIKNDLERCLYAGWFLFVVICTLLGDSIILAASIKYKAFNLHKIVLVFIQYIAVCDLINALLCLLPTAISAFFDSGGSSMILNQVRFLLPTTLTA